MHLSFNIYTSSADIICEIKRRNGRQVRSSYAALMGTNHKVDCEERILPFSSPKNKASNPRPKAVSKNSTYSKTEHFQIGLTKSCLLYSSVFRLQSCARRGVRYITDVHPPNTANMLCLQDMGKEEFKFVCEELGRPYMKASTEQPAFPVPGLIHNADYGRRCVCLIVEHGKSKIWVPFVVDGGSPHTLLGADALVGSVLIRMMFTVGYRLQFMAIRVWRRALNQKIRCCATSTFLAGATSGTPKCSN